MKDWNSFNLHAGQIRKISFESDTFAKQHECYSEHMNQNDVVMFVEIEIIFSVHFVHHFVQFKIMKSNKKEKMI